MVCLRKLKPVILQHALMVTLAVALALTLGCSPEDEEDDVWSDITSFSQANGTWKAQFRVAYNTQSITATQRFYNYTVTIDATAKTMSTSGTKITAFSGGNIDAYWPSIKADENLANMEQQEGVILIFNDENHSYSAVYDNYTEQFSDDDLKKLDPQINQHGTKLKFYFNDEGSYEVIYTKL